MQILCRCAHCGHSFTSDQESQVSLEFDFMDQEVRFVCRNKGCKRQNTISFANKGKTQPLPQTLVAP